MLRITVHDSPRSLTVQLEGRLAGQTEAAAGYFPFGALLFRPN